MKPVYQELLCEKEPGLGLIVADMLQSFFWASMQTILFPAIALIDIYKSYLQYKQYKLEKNKNIRKKMSLAVRLLTTSAEIVASVALVSAFCGIQLLTASITSFIMLGTIAAQCISHLTQTIYHGIQWALSERDTQKNEKHKTQFQNHLKNSIVTGAICAGLCTSIFFPVFHLIAFSVGMTIVGLNAIKIGYSMSRIHHENKQQKIEWQYNYNQARKIRAKARNCLIEKKFENIDGPLYSEDKTRAYFPHNQLRMKYKNYQPNLKDDDIKDLICAMEAMDEIDGPQKFLLKLLRNSIDAIVKNLNVEYERDPKSQQMELNKHGCLPKLCHKNFSTSAYLQETKLRDKLHAVLSLEVLAKDKRNSLNIIENNKTATIDTVNDLTYYLEKNNKIDNVFQSTFQDSKVKKLFALVDYYLNHPDLHPETRKSYEEINQFRVTPIRTRLAALY